MTELTEGTPPKVDNLARARAAKAAKREADVAADIGAQKAALAETPEEKRTRLLAELAELPVPEAAKNEEPGTIRFPGTALAEKVPFTRRWFEKNVEMVEFIAAEDGQVILNGVKYVWKANSKARIPATHYAVWEDARLRKRIAEQQFDPPAQLPHVAGQSSPIYRMGVGLMEPIPDEK